MAHFFQLRETHFALWRPRLTDVAPVLHIGEFKEANPFEFIELKTADFTAHPDHPDLWIVPVSTLGLTDGKVYHYFFEVTDSNPYRNSGKRIWCTDPFAYAVDWRIQALKEDASYGDGDLGPASVIKFMDGRLVPSDVEGEEILFKPEGAEMLRAFGGNNNLVIYELPTSWSRTDERGRPQLDAGSFRDVLALVDEAASPANFAGVAALESRAHLVELGVNALELLPPADSWVARQWGYATSNYAAPDYDLGFPEYYGWPTPVTDLAKLVEALHARNIRFFTDVVMGFANRCPYRNINFLDFHVEESREGHPEIDPEKDGRGNWGGDLFKYAYLTDCYDPLSGGRTHGSPARLFMKAVIEHWMRSYRVDGIRVDSTPTIKNWDFLGEYVDHARSVWDERAGALSRPERDARFLVVGEELSGDQVKIAVDGPLDGSWNEHFMSRVRYAVCGQNHPDDPDFETTIRNLIDCRRLGYADGAQAVNYLTSHDVEGYRKERLFNFLQNNQVVSWRNERIQLAFACLLTAVGIPMIFAGEEFADQHDLTTTHPAKQMDSLNFERLDDPWRREIFDYVSRLVRLRVACPALGMNDVEFIHVDFNGGKRVLCWKRGIPQSGALVVVVANFSDWGQPLGSEYRVANWPAAPAGRQWKEVTRDRIVDGGWVGREGLFPWEAKVYVTV